MPAAIWRASLVLTQKERHELDELATRIYLKTRHRPNVSVLVRALLDRGLAEFSDDKRLAGLNTALDLHKSRDADEVVAAYLRR